MIPVDVNQKNVLQWLYFGLLEAWRILLATLRREGSRELGVARAVERDARAGDPDSVLAVMDTYAENHRFLMNVGVEKGEVLARTLEATGASRVLELGAYCGYSAVLIGRHLARTGGELVSLEVSSANAAVARRVVAHAGLSHVVDIRVGPAARLIPTLMGPFDVVFIDHWKDDYLSDLHRIEDADLLRPGSRIVADNVGVFGRALRSYLEYVRTSAHLRSSHHALPMEYNADIGDGVEVTVWNEVSFPRAVPSSVAAR